MLEALVILAIAGSIAAAFFAYRAASVAAQAEKGDERLERAFRDEMARARQEMLQQIGGLQAMARQQADALASQHREQLTVMTSTLHGVRSTVDERIQALQTDNAAKLEQMRRTVDEQLQGTLEKRLSESFQLVSERLEQVYRGLGEMQTLAAGVGDLKKALTNVRVRGTYGEVQLEMLLEQMMSPEQYQKQASITGSAERVDFAIRLPGRDPAQDAVWLPVDAKFPLEDYYRLVDAVDAEALEAATRLLPGALLLVVALRLAPGPAATAAVGLWCVVLVLIAASGGVQLWKTAEKRAVVWCSESGLVFAAVGAVFAALHN